MRAHNTALLLQAIWCEHGVSRADLARRTGLSRATVSDIVGGFVHAGAVSEYEAAPSNGGRPPIRLGFEDQWRHIVGIELGASHVTGVRTDLRGHVLASFQQELDVHGDPNGTLAAIDAGVVALLAHEPAVPVLGIGIGVPSPVPVADRGGLAHHLFPRWQGIDLVRHLGATHGLPVQMDNDANLGALAEHWWGAGRGYADLAYVKVATGVGAGILIRGRIHRGATGIAGEIGHTAIDPGGPRCRCGLNGCLEALVGTASLLRRAQEELTASPSLPAWANQELTVQALIAAAEAGDPTARDLITGAGQSLGVAMANLLNLVNPGRIVLGGHLTAAGAMLLDPLRSTLSARALWSSVEGSELVVSPLGDQAVALGAATLLLQAALEDPQRLMTPAPRVFPPLVHAGRPAPTFERSP